MKPLMILSIVLILLYGCATTRPVDSPSKDCVIFSPHTSLPIIIKKGFFNKPENFLTPDEFKAEYQEWLKREMGL